MVRWLLIPALLILCGGRGLCQDGPQIPETASPYFATVVKLDRAAGVLTFHSMMLEKVKQYGTYEQDGKKVQGWYWDHVYGERQVPFSLKDGQAYDALGTRLSGDEFWKRAAVGATVLVAPDGQKVAAGYLRVVRQETLILVPPPPKPSPAMPSPAELAPAGPGRDTKPQP
jgi:hypothetical protein